MGLATWNCRYLMPTLAVVAASAWWSCYTVAIAMGTAWMRVPVIAVVGTRDIPACHSSATRSRFGTLHSPNSARIFASAWWAFEPICGRLENLGQWPDGLDRNPYANA